jgi:hypothetical protein
VSVVAGALTRVRLELQPNVAPSQPSIARPLWVATGVLAALTVGSGVITLVNKRGYEDELGQPHTQDPLSASRDLESQRNQLDTWLVVTDVLAAATLVSGAAALYFSR